MVAYIDEFKDRFRVGPIRRMLAASLDCGFITPRGYRMFRSRPVSRMAARHEAPAGIAVLVSWLGRPLGRLGARCAFGPVAGVIRRQRDRMGFLPRLNVGGAVGILGMVQSIAVSHKICFYYTIPAKQKARVCAAFCDSLCGFAALSMLNGARRPFWRADFQT